MIGPSCIHKNGYEYKVIGTTDILVLNDEKTLKLENTLNQIYQRYSASSSNTNQSLSLPSTDEMDKEYFVVYEGNNRHLHTLRKIESWFSKSNKTLTFDELFVRSKKWNDEHCKGPLNDYQISELVKQGMDYINKRNNTEIEKPSFESENHVNQQISLSKQDNQPNLQKILEKILDKTLIEYVIDTIKKTVKCEDTLIKQILYTTQLIHSK